MPPGRAAGTGYPTTERHLPARRTVGRGGRWLVLSARRAGWRRLPRIEGQAPPALSCGLQHGQPRPRGASCGPPRRSPSSPTGGARWRGGAPGSPPPAPEHPPPPIVRQSPTQSGFAPTAPPSLGLQRLSRPCQASEGTLGVQRLADPALEGEVPRASSPAAVGALGSKEEARHDCRTLTMELER